MVMTDIPAGHDDQHHDDDMLTTGDAAEVIGYGTTRRQVIGMINNGTLQAVRLGPGMWAKVPRSAALAKRRELEEQLHRTVPEPDREQEAT